MSISFYSNFYFIFHKPFIGSIKVKVRTIQTNTHIRVNGMDIGHGQHRAQMDGEFDAFASEKHQIKINLSLPFAVSLFSLISQLFFFFFLLFPFSFNIFFYSRSLFFTQFNAAVFVLVHSHSVFHANVKIYCV